VTARCCIFIWRISAFEWPTSINIVTCNYNDMHCWRSIKYRIGIGWYKDHKAKVMWNWLVFRPTLWWCRWPDWNRIKCRLLESRKRPRAVLATTGLGPKLSQSGKCHVPWYHDACCVAEQTPLLHTANNNNNNNNNNTQPRWQWNPPSSTGRINTAFYRTTWTSRFAVLLSTSG